MSKEQIEMALGVYDPAMAERLAGWQQSRAATASGSVIAGAVDIDAGDGPAAGTIRILVAAVQRLADENRVLADEVARLRKGETTPVYGGFNPEGMSEAARKKLLYGVWNNGLAEEVKADPLPVGRGLESIADPLAWGSAGAFDAFRAEEVERAAEYAQELAAAWEIERESAAADATAHRAEVAEQRATAEFDFYMGLGVHVDSPAAAGDVPDAAADYGPEVGE